MDLPGRGASWILLLVTAALAGCADEAGDLDDEGDAPLSAGTGAISGLLVDDRFRPLELTDDPRSEFQRDGFVLLVETGEQAQTTSHGEFVFRDLEPGRYTLRVTADGHEAAPRTVAVEAGIHSEVSIVARRVISAAGTQIVTEFSVFIPCYFAFIVNGLLLDCTLDQSGETGRFSFQADYREHDDASFLITEMRSNTPKGLEVQVRGGDCQDDPEHAGSYAVARGDGHYIRVQNEHGVKNTEHDGQLVNKPWHNDCLLTTLLFGDAYPRKELWDLWPEDPGSPVWLNPIIAGLDVYMGVKAQFMQSFFIGTPDVSIDTYCLLCE